MIYVFSGVRYKKETRETKGMRLCIREGAPESVVTDGIYRFRADCKKFCLDGCSAVLDFDVFGRGLKNCIDADLFGGTGYVGGDWKKVWMWIDLGCSGV